MCVLKHITKNKPTDVTKNPFSEAVYNAGYNIQILMFKEQ